MSLSEGWRERIGADRFAHQTFLNFLRDDSRESDRYKGWTIRLRSFIASASFFSAGVLERLIEVQHADDTSVRFTISGKRNRYPQKFKLDCCLICMFDAICEGSSDTINRWLA